MHTQSISKEPEPQTPRMADPVKDFCESFPMSRSLLYKLARAGQIKLLRVGNRTLVPRSERDRLLREGASLDRRNAR